MKFIKKFNEGSNRYDASDVMADVKEIFLTISDSFKTTFDLDSDGLPLIELKINILTKKFIPDSEYMKKEYVKNFFSVVSYYGNDYQKELIAHYNSMVGLYNNIDQSLDRLKEVYSGLTYSIDQKDLNYSEIVIKIYIKKV